MLWDSAVDEPLAGPSTAGTRASSINRAAFPNFAVLAPFTDWLGELRSLAWDNLTTEGAAITAPAGAISC